MHINSLVETKQFTTHTEATKLYQKISGPLRDRLPSSREVRKMILPGSLDLLRTGSATDNLSDYSKSVGRSPCSV